MIKKLYGAIIIIQRIHGIRVFCFLICHYNLLLTITVKKHAGFYLFFFQGKESLSYIIKLVYILTKIIE